MESDVLCLLLSQPISCEDVASLARVRLRPGDLGEAAHVLRPSDVCGDDAAAEGAGHTGRRLLVHLWLRLLSLPSCAQLRDFLRQQLRRLDSHQALEQVGAVISRVLQAAASANEKPGAHR